METNIEKGGNMQMELPPNTQLVITTEFQGTLQAGVPLPEIPVTVIVDIPGQISQSYPLNPSNNGTQSIKLTATSIIESGNSAALPLPGFSAFIEINGLKMPVPVLTYIAPGNSINDPLDNSTPQVRVILTNAIITVDTPPDV